MTTPPLSTATPLRVSPISIAMCCTNWLRTGWTKAPHAGRWTNFVSCDSSFAALLAETGYVGLGLMGLFLFYVLWTTLRTFWRVDRQDKLLCILFFVNLAAFCFEMTNVAILGWGQQTILLWAIIAMTMIYPSLCAAASTASGEHDAADRTEQDDATVGELALVSISSR
jgi:hypothetical protein